MGQDELKDRVRSLLRRAIEARYEAGPHTRKVQAQAYADGYIRALGDAELLAEHVLRQLVLAERESFLADEQARDAALEAAS